MLLMVALDLSAVFLVVVLDLSAVFLVGSIDGVAAQMFPDKQIHADPEDCPTIAELLPLKRKEQTIKTETRKQKDQIQSNQPPWMSAGVSDNRPIIVGRNSIQLALRGCSCLFLVFDLLAFGLHLKPPSVVVSRLMIKSMESLSMTAFGTPFADLVPMSDHLLSFGDLP